MAKARILVVEDENIVALDIRNRLEKMGYEVIESVATGDEAINLAVEHIPDLILMDIQLKGDLDGIETANIIRKTNDVPVVFATAYADKNILSRAKLTEAFGYIIKPFQDRELNSNIEIALYKHKMEKKIRESQRQLSTLISNLPGMVYRRLNDMAGSIKFASKGCNYLIGYTEEDMIGIPYYELIYKEDVLYIRNKVSASVQNKKSFRFEYRVRNANGHYIWVMEQGTPIFTSSGEVDGIEGFVTNIDDRKKAEEALYKSERRAEFYEYHDQLTKLPNKEMFRERLKKEISISKVRNKVFAVMCLGIDKFKNINSLYGPDKGDMLLQKLGIALKETFREDDIVSRYSGDKFMILLSDIGGTSSVIGIVRKTFDIFRRPFKLESNLLRVTASIGVCLYPQDGEDLSLLIKNSETAMFLAKENGGNTYRVFDSRMNSEILERVQMERELEFAINNNEFLVYYQPKVDRNGAILGMESLIRWQSSKKNELIPPYRFIPIAEATGMIVDIGNIVLYKACLQNKKWQDEGYTPVRTAVNLSPFQFKQPDLVDTITRVLKMTGLDAKWLELEITETGIMEDEFDSIQKLNEIHAMGISISIDDFGTGYSSLSKLKDYPIDTLKIDKSFVDNLPHDVKSSTITTSIIALAHNLGFKVVSEGVEVKEQLDFLDELNCDQYQGYYFSRPVPAEEFEKLMKK